ncbi:radical SAM protein, partial [bacterium]
MKKLNVVLGDLAYFNRYALHNNYVPLGAGYIATYLKQHFDRDINISIFKDPAYLIEHAKDNRVHIVGLSLYYWNKSLDKIVVEKLRQLYGDSVVIILGGPCVDTDKQEQRIILQRFSKVNAVVENEGELGFANIVHKYLSNHNNLWEKPIDGCSFLRREELIKGGPVGLTLDLEKLGSPYLNSFMEQFINKDFLPLLQTSRGCPYTCTFCVSGKNRCVLRKFPLEQIREEIVYLAKRYANRPSFTLFITDENFGIFPRDVVIAEYIKKSSAKLGYPKQVFFYNDKKFNATSRKIIEKLGNINQLGLAIAVQSSNLATLESIKRNNMSSDDIGQAIAWARQNNIPTTTEMIFGLPCESLKSFLALLEHSAKKGFDSILCHNLFLMDGIELNRQSMREKYGLKTKYRPLASSYGKVGEGFSVESEEVVVESKTFSFKDFLIIRNINFIFYSIYALSFYKWFFNALIRLDLPFIDFLHRFVYPDRSYKWPKEYLEFIDDLKKAFLGELYSSTDELEANISKIYEENNDVVSPSRLNVYYGARLIFVEKWISNVLETHLEHFNISSEQESVLREAILIS